MSVSCCVQQTHHYIHEQHCTKRPQKPVKFTGFKRIIYALQKNQQREMIKSVLINAKRLRTICYIVVVLVVVVVFTSQSVLLHDNLFVGTKRT